MANSRLSAAPQCEASALEAGLAPARSLEMVVTLTERVELGLALQIQDRISEHPPTRQQSSSEAELGQGIMLKERSRRRLLVR
ncbi:hypothetical protein [Agrobacterium tumefaciens]|uniref:hypothetical protein n=1 Tax=Agrobacterium tumefaciens TaxID=358 RepID=UPI001573EE8C|nr:hypothetical protein [Agrobacterium tumefaciens]